MMLLYVGNSLAGVPPYLVFKAWDSSSSASLQHCNTAENTVCGSIHSAYAAFITPYADSCASGFSSRGKKFGSCGADQVDCYVHAYFACSSLKACAANEVRSPSTGLCTLDCPAGQTKQLNVSNLDSSGHLLIRIGGSETLADGGCQYTCSNSNAIGDKAYYGETGGVKFNYMPHMCTSTGQPSTASDSLPAVSDPTQSTQEQPAAPTDPNQPTCNVDPTTKALICTGGNLPAGCSTINGVQVCPEQKTLAGDTTQAADEKNCQRANGQTLCVVDPASEDAQFCGTVNGVTQCYSTQSSVKKTETEEVLPDGTIRKRIEESDGVKGNPPTVTIRETAPDGTVTEIKTGPKGISSNGPAGTLEEINQGIKGQKEGLDGIKEAIDGVNDTLKDGGEGFQGEEAGDENSLYEKTSDTWQSTYSAFVDQVKTQPLYQAVSTAFDVSIASCSCPVWSTTFNMFGQSFPVVFDQLCSDVVTYTVLPAVSAVISIVAALIAIRFAFL